MNFKQELGNRYYCMSLHIHIYVYVYFYEF